MHRSTTGMDLATLQARVEERYGEGDEEMGLRFLVLVLVEEVGELAEAVRRGDEAGEALAAIRDEVVDVAFMAVSIANRLGVDLGEALEAKYLDRSVEDVTASWTDAAWRDEAGEGP